MTNTANYPKKHQEVELTQLDKQILQILQENGKASLRSIAQKLNSSVSAVKNHVDKLTETGVIQSYTALIDCCKIGYKEMLLLFIRVSNSVPISEIFDKLAKIDKINAIYQISGTYAIFCMAKCVEKEDQILLLEVIKKIIGIEEIHTQVVLQRIKEDLRVKIP
ncbi:MAG: hypothetical protein DRO88_07700 [Promethearchaeia archaeon]|nr:MAG: hypothetical protein DRO88_07700 [Candidatus Lokiarchaeia archaeon]